MRIRSVTVGIDATWPLDGSSVEQAGVFLRAARSHYEAVGVEVQTTRLATSPFAELSPESDGGWALDLARAVENLAGEQDIGYVSLGPVRWARLASRVARGYADVLPELISSTQSVFVALETAAEGKLYAKAAEAAGRVIAQVARDTELGFGNLRFCTIALCDPNIPFFPAAYHAGGPPRFSLALEAADIVRQAFCDSRSLDEAQVRLRQEMERHLRPLEEVARGLERGFGVAYAGADLTPAPFPADEISAAGMLEDLGVDAIGAAGSVAAATALTAMVKQLPFQKTGFSGLMLPVLEDSLLAARVSDGVVSWSELLLYSAVCGTGLDTIPLPGNAGQEELAGIVLDVAALAVALGKPLTCRLLPVPGKEAGEFTEYDFPYFKNTRVMPLKGYGSGRLFARLPQ